MTKGNQRTSKRRELLVGAISCFAGALAWTSACTTSTPAPTLTSTATPTRTPTSPPTATLTICLAGGSTCTPTNTCACLPIGGVFYALLEVTGTPSGGICGMIEVTNQSIPGATPAAGSHYVVSALELIDPTSNTSIQVGYRTEVGPGRAVGRQAFFAYDSGSTGAVDGDYFVTLGTNMDIQVGVGPSSSSTTWCYRFVGGTASPAVDLGVTSLPDQNAGLITDVCAAVVPPTLISVLRRNPSGFGPCSSCGVVSWAVSGPLDTAPFAMTKLGNDSGSISKCF